MPILPSSPQPAELVERFCDGRGQFEKNNPGQMLWPLHGRLGWYCERIALTWPPRALYFGRFWREFTMRRYPSSMWVRLLRISTKSGLAMTRLSAKSMNGFGLTRKRALRQPRWERQFSL